MSNATTTEIKGANKRPKKPTDFILLCDAAHTKNVVYALYYLPKNYKLRVVGRKELATSSALPAATVSDAWNDDQYITSRITYDEQETPSDAPFSNVDAVITSDRTSLDVAPHITLGEPEAIASAALQLARSAA